MGNGYSRAFTRMMERLIIRQTHETECAWCGRSESLETCTGCGLACCIDCKQCAAVAYASSPEVRADVKVRDCPYCAAGSFRTVFKADFVTTENKPQRCVLCQTLMDKHEGIGQGNVVVSAYLKNRVMFRCPNGHGVLSGLKCFTCGMEMMMTKDQYRCPKNCSSKFRPPRREYWSS